MPHPHRPRPHEGARSLLRRLSMPALLLVASGAASLIYQVLWIKQLSLVVGIEVQAITVGVSAFFLGLAFGSAAFGRLIERIGRPWFLYAALETGTAVLGVAATYGLPHAAPWFATIQDHAGPLAWALPITLVGLPAFLMGGTLPTLLFVDRTDARSPGRAGGALYAANTTGAIIGTLLAGFVLIPHLGLSQTAWFAGALNLGAALVAYLIDRLQRSPTDDGESVERSHVMLRSARATRAFATDATKAIKVTKAFEATESTEATDKAKRSVQTSRRLAVSLYAVAGGVAMGYEVVWSQAMAPLISTRTFAFSVVLATYLAGIALGSALMQRRVERVRDPWGAFGLLIALAGAISVLELAFLGPMQLQMQDAVRNWVVRATDSMQFAMCSSFAVAALWVVFVPTVLLGAAMPLAMHLGTDREHAQRDIGVIVAANTAGGVVGMGLTGFALIPLIGVVRALAALGIIAVAMGGVAVWRGRRGGSVNAARVSDAVQGGKDAQQRRGSGVDHTMDGVAAGRLFHWGVAAAIVATLIPAIATPPDQLARLLLTVHRGELISYEESAGGAVAVVEQKAGSHRFRRLYIQGVSNSGDAMTSLRYMRLQTLLPLIIHRGDAKSALVIGAGTGITAGAMLTWPGLEHRVVAELLPAVVRSVPRFSGNFDVSRNPSVDIRIRDGRRELLSHPQTYDLITLEPPPPSAAGVVNLYSTDFYRIAGQRLNRNGMVAQWLPLSTQNENDTRSLIRSFTDVFPYASLWTTELHEALLIGSMEPMELDWPSIAAKFGQPTVAAALREVGIASPQALLATWISDQSGLQYYAADAAPVTDDMPRIEYAPWVRRDAFVTTLPHLLALRSSPQILNASQAARQEIEDQTAILRTFYRAAFDAYRDDRDAWAADMRDVMRADGSNAYYRWIAPAE